MDLVEPYIPACMAYKHRNPEKAQFDPEPEPMVDVGPAKIRSIKIYDKKDSCSHYVYDIGVEGLNNYVAGNIIVHNSMCDLFMVKHLFSAVKNGARVLLVGDIDQLPSVGPGNVLKDLIGFVPCVKLNKIFRQTAESSIVVNAHRVNNGQMPVFDKTKKDLVFLERETPEEIIECVKTCLKNLPYGPLDVQVLAPMRKGPVGTEEINCAIQEMLSGTPKRSKKGTKSST